MATAGTSAWACPAPRGQETGRWAACTAQARARTAGTAGALPLVWGISGTRGARFRGSKTPSGNARLPTRFWGRHSAWRGASARFSGTTTSRQHPKTAGCSMSAGVSGACRHKAAAAARRRWRRWWRAAAGGKFRPAWALVLGPPSGATCTSGRLARCTTLTTRFPWVPWTLEARPWITLAICCTRSRKETRKRRSAGVKTTTTKPKAG